MKLIVGLGNPGKEYEYTRHNIGFMVLNTYLGNVKWKTKNNALYYEKSINNEKYIFIKPLTFMNLSGEAVIKYVNYYNVDIKDVLVIHDDLDLPIGSFRLKENSSSGGHNGIKSIINCLHSNSFRRLKIGVSNNKTIDTKDYVLGKFSKSDIESLNSIINQCANIIEEFSEKSFLDLMSQYNKRVHNE